MRHTTTGFYFTILAMLLHMGSVGCKDYQSSARNKVETNTGPEPGTITNRCYPDGLVGNYLTPEHVNTVLEGALSGGHGYHCRLSWHGTDTDSYLCNDPDGFCNGSAISLAKRGWAPNIAFCL